LMAQKGIIFLLSSILFLGALFLLAKPAQAALVVLDKEGAIVWNVLSMKAESGLEIPKRESLEVREIALQDLQPSAEAQVSLTRKDGRVFLNVSSQSGERLVDVTDYQDELIKIEERGEIQSISIANIEDKFAIGQKNVIALTEFSISIDAKTSELLALTPSGSRYIAVLPYEAVANVLKARIMSRLLSDSGEIELKEGSKGELHYFIQGEKEINLFDLISFPVEVKAAVSASTGQILEVEQPTWLRILGFLFV